MVVGLSSRQAIVLCVAPLLIGACTVVHVGTEDTTEPTITRVVTFKPWNDGNLTDGMITTTETGHCWTTSIASERGDAYRCTVENTIHDPCFANAPAANADKVACPRGNPNNVAVIELTRPLPEPTNPIAEGGAWRLVLDDGQECGRLTGTLPPDHASGLESNGIACTNGWGYGDLDSTQPMWTIQLAKDEDAPLVTKRVAEAYR